MRRTSLDSRSTKTCSLGWYCNLFRVVSNWCLYIIWYDTVAVCNLTEPVRCWLIISGGGGGHDSIERRHVEAVRGFRPSPRNRPLTPQEHNCVVESRLLTEAAMRMRVPHCQCLPRASRNVAMHSLRRQMLFTLFLNREFISFIFTRIVQPGRTGFLAAILKMLPSTTTSLSLSTPNR